MTLQTRLFGLLGLLFVVLVEGACAQGNITAKTINGTYQGRYLREYDQDLFLGMPFALPQTGDRRFRRPQYINSTFPEVRSAFGYGPACLQWNGFTGNRSSEDCLNINVVRPARTKIDAKLPILVWIYGGGFEGGGTSDPRYNMSALVRLSQDIGKPILGVSINYRVNKLGFLQTPEILKEGSSNAGMHDQRLALMWIQENIAAFGGDSSRVTIWGESAGAQSIGLHLHSYDGKDEGLYHAAILESGGPVGTPLQTLAFYKGYMEALCMTFGCNPDPEKEDRIACLRAVSTEKWANTQTAGLVWNPLIDGEMWTDYPSVLASQKKFVKVPLLIGTNSDEGANFATSGGMDNETALWQSMLSYRNYAISPSMAKKLLELYPDDPTSEPPYYINPNPVRFPTRGLMWRRLAAIEGDMVMVAGRRRVCEQFTEAGVSVYSYRFDQLAYKQDPNRGVTHFQNVAYSFQNISGSLGPLPEYATHMVLAENIGRAYISFVYDYNPNTSRGNGSTLPEWLAYDLSSPQNMVLNASRSYMEDDTYRKEGIAYLNQVSSDLQIKS